jgi:2-phosphosulfolactate phosphatase
MTTTNGTATLLACKPAETIWIGAFANFSTVVQALLADPSDTVVVCAGWKNDANLEDTAYAGALLSALDSCYYPGNEAATLAHSFYRQHQADWFPVFRKSVHRHKVYALNIQADARFCFQLDTAPVLPHLYGQELVVSS